MGEEAKTAGEILFEGYLISQGYTDFEHEVRVERKSQRPDYTIRIEGEVYLCELKDFVQTRPLPRGGVFSFDSYGLIREKINAGRKKFKQYKDRPCGLVLYNVDMPLLELQEPDVMFGAMEGDFGIVIPFDPETGRGDESGIHQAFLEGGKMINPKTSRPQNTTISALVTLRYVNIGFMRHRKFYRDGFNLPKEQRDEYFSREINFDPEERYVGVMVWENRFARVPLTRHLFRGRYDERYVYDGEYMQRTFAGEGVLEYESLKPPEE